MQSHTGLLPLACSQVHMPSHGIYSCSETASALSTLSWMKHGTRNPLPRYFGDTYAGNDTHFLSLQLGQRS